MLMFDSITVFKASNKSQIMRLHAIDVELEYIKN